MWNKYDKSKEPDLETIAKYMNTPLWDKFYTHMQEACGGRYKIEYSGCSMQAGWNIKFKKSGKTLCTVYPMEGGFLTMVVIGEKEATEVQFALPSFTGYVQKVYAETNPGNSSKWLTIEIQNEKVLDDVFLLMEIRKKCSICNSVKKKNVLDMIS